MFPSDHSAEAFFDRLERDWIRCALVAARPDLEDAMVLEGERPMIRIPSPHRGAILVAKTDDGPTAQWIVGVPGRPDPSIHEPGSGEELVRIVLAALEGPGPHQQHAPYTEGM
ncbi:MAG TPA: hypothetical protein H9786_01645 [Candidatus Brachybacterium merdavium]|uniref:Uncharacterized protein n=1 Tax=Candidatus Brachybacterium merdavium TaxID=2838513 RepID=A0A9D2LB85_9MICO|nr:hypothetical protein [Candidatus Brachybacterium merdavium]